MPTRGLTVCGTNTDVGKTYLSGLILRALQAGGVSVGAYKPVCSGVSWDEAGQPFWSDARLLADACAGRFTEAEIAPQCFAAPLSPPRSARLEGRQVNSQQILQDLNRWQKTVDYLLIETAGGLLSPMSEEWTMADFAVQAGYPLLLVARVELGLINQVLLTLESASRRGLRVAGIVLNAAGHTEQSGSLEDLTADLLPRISVPLLGLLPYNGSQLVTFQQQEIAFDWAKLFDISHLAG